MMTSLQVKRRWDRLAFVKVTTIESYLEAKNSFKNILTFMGKQIQG